jgi:predicted amidohydrolase
VGGGESFGKGVDWARMRKNELVVAAVQLSSQSDVLDNLARSVELCSRARSRGAELIVLPENFAFSGPEEERRGIAESLGDASAPIQRCLGEIARSTGAWLVAGGFPERSRDPLRPHNTALALDPAGGIAAVYRKIHLFDVELGDGASYAESASTEPGSEVVVFDADGVTVGLSICYDLRFPELYRALAARGADVVLVPAAFTLHTGKDHWHVLLRARAIESQAFVVAAAQWGKHPRGRQSYGHSLIVDPWGTVVADCPDGIGIVTATLERARLEAVRRSLPALAHRRLTT